jgi:hypothetical protein
MTRWNRFWFAPAPAEDLAITRLVFAGGVFLNYVTADLHGYGDVPRGFYQPSALFQHLGLPILDGARLAPIEAIWLLAWLALALGFFTRSAAIVALVGSLYLLGIRNSFPRMSFHSDIPTVFLGAIFVGARSADVLSVDAWLARRRGRPIALEPEEYGWPRQLARVFLAWMFFAAGVAKIRHSGFPEWILSDTTWISLVAANYGPIGHTPAPFPALGAALVRWSDAFATGLAALTQFTELLYPLALVSSVARWILLPAMIALLGGIWVTMGPVFFVAVLAHAFWVPWSAIMRRTAARSSFP